MNKTSTSRSWLQRGAWGAVVLLVGLFLSTCEPAGLEGDDPEGMRTGQGGAGGQGGPGAPGGAGQGGIE